LEPSGQAVNKPAQTAGTGQTFLDQIISGLADPSLDGFSPADGRIDKKNVGPENQGETSDGFLQVKKWGEMQAN
jgi:hypothetical protein